MAAARADWSYVIPRGTGAPLDRREPVRILPARIDAHVGEVIRIVNRDSRGYLLGPFFVAAHRTLTQRFTSPGIFEAHAPCTRAARSCSRCAAEGARSHRVMSGCTRTSGSAPE